MAKEGSRNSIGARWQEEDGERWATAYVSGSGSKIDESQRPRRGATVRAVATRRLGSSGTQHLIGVRARVSSVASASGATWGEEVPTLFHGSDTSLDRVSAVCSPAQGARRCRCPPPAVCHGPSPSRTSGSSRGLRANGVSKTCFVLQPPVLKRPPPASPNRLSYPPQGRSAQHSDW